MVEVLHLPWGLFGEVGGSFQYEVKSVLFFVHYLWMGFWTATCIWLSVTLWFHIIDAVTKRHNTYYKPPPKIWKPSSNKKNKKKIIRKETGHPTSCHYNSIAIKFYCHFLSPKRLSLLFKFKALHPDRLTRLTDYSLSAFYLCGGWLLCCWCCCTWVHRSQSAPLSLHLYVLNLR